MTIKLYQGFQMTMYDARIPPVGRFLPGGGELVVIKVRETQKHLDAFEHFIELGATATDKNFSIIAGKFGVVDRTVSGVRQITVMIHVKE